MMSGIPSLLKSPRLITLAPKPDGPYAIMKLSCATARLETASIATAKSAIFERKRTGVLLRMYMRSSPEGLERVGRFRENSDSEEIGKVGAKVRHSLPLWGETSKREPSAIAPLN